MSDPNASIGTWCACCSEPLRLGEIPYFGKNGINAYCAACGNPDFFEYSVLDKYSGLEITCHEADEALTKAAHRSISCGREQIVDLCCGSRAAAHALGELESYDEGPDASVTRRVVVRAVDKGRIA